MTKLDICFSDIVIAVLSATTLVFCVIFFNGATAESMSRSKYQALEKNLMTEYTSAKVRCNPLFGNEKALCEAKAEGAKNIAKGELEASISPMIENRYNANLIRSDATLTIAKEQCGGSKVAEQVTCQKVANESQAKEMSSAKSQRDMEKSGEIKKDKTVKLDEPSHKNNPFITVEFNNIYQVKA